MKKIILFVFVAAFAFSSCEKDDICDPATPTTPRLIIGFYNISNPSLPKRVTNLKVIGEGMTEGIVFNKNATDETRYLTNGSSVAIPLRTDQDTCSFAFILNDGNSNVALINEDVLKFTYSRSNEFVSRACGFKTVFQLNSPVPVLQTDGPANDGFWMQVVVLENSNIQNENEAHIKVYF